MGILYLRLAPYKSGLMVQTGLMTKSFSCQADLSALSLYHTSSKKILGKLYEFLQWLLMLTYAFLHILYHFGPSRAILCRSLPFGTI